MKNALAALLVSVCGLWPQSGWADTPNWTEQSRVAASEIAAAQKALRTTVDPQERLTQLARAIAGYERALSAMRAGARLLSVEADAAKEALLLERRKYSRVLGMLQNVGRAPVPVLMLHPDGPQGAARAAQLSASLIPLLEKTASDAANRATLWQTLEREQEEAERMMREGLSQMQAVRSDLAQALANRDPARRPNDMAAITRLGEDANSLQEFSRDFATYLGETSLQEADPFEEAFGAMALPVQGRLLRGFGVADAAGLVRPGMILEAAPAALVTAPWSATLRYSGAFLDYGQIVVLEPAQGVMLILAGLGRVDREAGEVLQRGEPIGVLHGKLASVSDTDPAAGFDTETIYVELRIDGAPVNPEKWFNFSQDGDK